MTPGVNSSIANVVCGGIILIVLGLPLFLLSRLLKIEHDDFHDQWVKDGRPHGMPFWFPLDELQLLGFRSYPWYMGYWWLFKTPDWVKGHPAASTLFRYYRLVSYLIYFGLFGMCLLLFLYTVKMQ
jgi:hypothetical protein